METTRAPHGHAETGTRCRWPRQAQALEGALQCWVCVVLPNPTVYLVWSLSSQKPLLAILPSSAGLIATSSVSLRDGVQTFDQTLSPGVAVICLHCTFVFESRA